jgi:hypothetical protein
MPRNDRASEKPPTRQARARKRAYVHSKIAKLQAAKEAAEKVRR